MGSGKPIRVHLSIGGTPCGKVKKEPPAQPDPFPPDYLEPHATLDAFIAPSDSLTLNLLKEVVDKPSTLGHYNPIYIQGPKGCGKSHLLMALASKLQSLGKKCFYVHAQTFTEHVIRAFRSSSLSEFRSSYRDIEVLLIDDVHLFSRKGATQEELFHTFNRLHTGGHQIILTSNVMPCHLEDIEDRLVSRFEWGITLTLSKPNQQESEKILLDRAVSLQLPLSKELTEYLMRSFKNLSSSIQALEALSLRLPHSDRAPDLEIACYYLKDLVEKEQKSYVTSEKILKVTAETFGIKTEDILGKKQSKEQVIPRQIGMYLCRKWLKMPFLKIGHLFGRDHSTVMTSVKRVTIGIEKKEEGFTQPLFEIEKILKVR